MKNKQMRKNWCNIHHHSTQRTILEMMIDFEENECCFRKIFRKQQQQQSIQMKKQRKCSDSIDCNQVYFGKNGKIAKIDWNHIIFKQRSFGTWFFCHQMISFGCVSEFYIVAVHGIHSLFWHWNESYFFVLSFEMKFRKKNF